MGWVRQHEARLRAIFDAAPVGLLRLSPEGRIERANGSVARLLGRPAPELYGRALVELVVDDDRGTLTHALQRVRDGEEAQELELRFLRAPGAASVEGCVESAHLVPTTVSLARAAAASADDHPFVVASLQDETVHQRLELELRHAQKLEAVGRLAAGIAHEINTPIQFVGDNARFLELAFGKLRAVLDGVVGLAREAVSPEGSNLSPADLDARLDALFARGRLGYLDEQVPRAIAQSLDGIGRVSSIVQGLKVFARRDGEEPAAADLERALSATLEVARNELKHVAEVVTELAGLPEVWCRVGDLNQVFLNLLVNAAHAIGDVEGRQGLGRITVRTAVVDDDGGEPRVRISISDTGTGIPEAARSRLFEPFFTTKEVGRGSGQGLALAHRIVVDGHGGTLTFDTEPGVGTTFHVTLPVGAPPAARGGDEVRAQRVGQNNRPERCFERPSQGGSVSTGPGGGVSR
jgi:PAS domain S-box-containing protein